MEDEPTVTEVTVRNPDTKEEIQIEISDELRQELATKVVPYGFYYDRLFKIRPDFVTGTTQVLEVFVPGQDVPAIAIHRFD